MVDKKTIQEFKDLYQELKIFTKSIILEFKGNLKYWISGFVTSYDLDKDYDLEIKYRLVIR